MIVSALCNVAAAVMQPMNTPPLPFEPSHRTTVTQLTPAGRGAIATLAIEGGFAIEAVGEFFRPISGKPLDASEIDRIRFGTWHHDNGDREEIVVCRRAESVIEIHCHGGDAAAAAIIAALTTRGALVSNEATWLHQRHHDPLLEFIRLRLAESRTQRTAGILLDQLHGACAKALGQIAASLEVNDRDLAGRRLQRLIDLAPLGRHLTTAWQIVVVGRPNVGKSSLVNTMLGFSRCIVFDQPGTTRDVVATHTALDGWPIELMDSAGLRDGQDAIEAEGVERALSKVATADLVVHVCDATRPCSNVIEPAIARHSNVLTVQNKVDLADKPRSSFDVQTSALTKTGVDRLIELMVFRLVPCCPTPGEAVPINDAQIQLIEDVQASIASGDIQLALETLSKPSGG